MSKPGMSSWTEADIKRIAKEAAAEVYIEFHLSRAHEVNNRTGTQQPVFALDVKQACAAMGGITPPTYYKEVAAGRLKTFKIRNRRFTTPEACREYIRAREQEAE